MASFHIQPDFLDCIKDVSSGVYSEDTFFINVEPSANQVDEYRVKVTLNGNAVHFDAGEGNLFERLSDQTFSACLDGKRCEFRTPKYDLTQTSTESLGPNFSSADSYKSCGNTKYVVGDSFGRLGIFDDRQRLVLAVQGHYADVNTVRFFPSGQVVLSGSADMQLKIWSATDGHCARTLRGHRGPVTATAIVDRGRNIMSSSSDGTVKLWECASGDTVHTYARDSSPSDAINTMVMQDSGAGQHEAESHQQEFGTAGKSVLAGHDSGVISKYDIYTKNCVLETSNQFMSSCRAMALSDSPSDPYSVYAGYANGILANWDLRNPSKAVHHLSGTNDSEVTAVHVQEGQLFVSFEQSSAVCFDINPRLGPFEDSTYLVSGTNRISAFAASKEASETISVGSEGFCAVY
ncbi:LAME_0H05028g1_1 [Lachancea meyersii CBS 8951]|uniref:LAME_0H05028g1_1 n=1 Tax=Lachancea meyersii CBS 8951 TaxID=1266667 RepID=A0A1G4KE12_9SACH|nr:LAME_0H05028g1_1 [Lachancea meyersii CBS 8951]